MYKYNATTNLEKIFDEIKRGSEIVGILVGITIASLFIALISESIYPLCMPVIVISSLVTYALGYNLFSKKEKIKRKMNKFDKALEAFNTRKMSHKEKLFYEAQLIDLQNEIDEEWKSLEDKKEDKKFKKAMDRCGIVSPEQKCKNLEKEIQKDEKALSEKKDNLEYFKMRLEEEGFNLNGKV